MSILSSQSDALVRPIAFLRGVLGNAFVVELEGGEHALITGPDYSLKTDMCGDWVLSSALVKHRFQLFSEQLSFIPY